MTTDSGIAPDPGEQPQVDQNAQVEQQTDPVVVDIDAREVADAKAAAEAEMAAGNGDGDGTQVAQPGSGQQAQPQSQPQQAQPEAIQVPKARLDEVLAQRDQKAQEAAYWRGVADAKVAGQAPPTGQPQQQQPTQPTAEQRLTALATEQDALAKKFDDGEITYSELKRQERELNGREQTIREELLLSRANATRPAPQQQENTDLYLDHMTAVLEQDHPWVVIADKVGTAVDWKYVQDKAIENLVQRGIDPSEGNRGKLALRTEVAELFDQLGPRLLADKAQKAGITIPNAAAPQQQQQQGAGNMSPVAQNRAAKLALAANAPPNLSQMNGTNGETTGAVSDSRLETMSDDEIGALPDSTRRKYLGLT